MLEFMVLAILLLTFLASFAVRRAEEEMIHHHELDQRARKCRRLSDKAQCGGV